MFGLVIALVFTIWIGPGSAPPSGLRGRASDRARVRVREWAPVRALGARSRRREPAPSARLPAAGSGLRPHARTCDWGRFLARVVGGVRNRCRSRLRAGSRGRLRPRVRLHPRAHLPRHRQWHQRPAGSACTRMSRAAASGSPIMVRRAQVDTARSGAGADRSDWAGRSRRPA